MRVGSNPNEQRTSAEGWLILLRCDVIEATQQMLSSRKKVDGVEPHQNPEIVHIAAAQSCALLQHVLAQLEQRTTVPMADTGKRMMADGVTDESIMHHIDPHAYIGMYFSDGSHTLAFVEAFKALLQKPRTKTAVKSRVRVETKVNVSAGGGAAQPSDDDGAHLPDDSDDGLGDLRSQLTKLRSKQLTIPSTERASLEKEIKRLSALIRAIEDMDHDEQLNVIQAEKRRMRIMELINAIGLCQMGFEWIWRPDLNGFQCAGGSHFVAADDVKMTEADKKWFTRELQQN